MSGEQLSRPATLSWRAGRPIVTSGQPRPRPLSSTSGAGEGATDKSNEEQHLAILRKRPELVDHRLLGAIAHLAHRRHRRHYVLRKYAGPRVQLRLPRR